MTCLKVAYSHVYKVFVVLSDQTYTPIGSFPEKLLSVLETKETKVDIITFLRMIGMCFVYLSDLPLSINVFVKNNQFLNRLRPPLFISSLSGASKTINIYEVVIRCILYITKGLEHIFYLFCI
jgi:hypothetical protein